MCGTANTWRSTTRGATSACECTMQGDCWAPGRSRSRFRGSWMIQRPRPQGRPNWGPWRLATGWSDVLARVTWPLRPSHRPLLTPELRGPKPERRTSAKESTKALWTPLRKPPSLWRWMRMSTAWWEMTPRPAWIATPKRCFTGNVTTGDFLFLCIADRVLGKCVIQFGICGPGGSTSPSLWFSIKTGKLAWMESTRGPTHQCCHTYGRWGMWSKEAMVRPVHLCDYH